MMNAMPAKLYRSNTTFCSEKLSCPVRTDSETNNKINSIVLVCAGACHSFEHDRLGIGVALGLVVRFELAVEAHLAQDDCPQRAALHFSCKV